MAGCLTESVKARVLDLLLGGRPYEPPRALDIGLSLGAANEAGLVVEPNDPAYERVRVRNDLDHFPPAGFFEGCKANAVRIVFPAPRRDWGLVRSVFVAEPGGDVVCMIQLARPLRVRAGGPPPVVATGALCWRLC